MRSTTLLSLSAGPYGVSRVSILLAFAAVVMLTTAAHAEPMSIRIDDHDFCFDVPVLDGFGAVYDYNGDEADRLTVTAPISGNHYVSSYSYTGVVSTVLDAPAPSPYLYPVASLDPVASLPYFGGNLEMQMTFDLNDGPYVAPSGNEIDISLTNRDSDGGYLEITGQIFSQDLLSTAPILPPADDVLLHIDFTQVSLMARVNENRLYLVEGVGTVTKLLGEEVELPDVGVTFFKFFAEDENQAMFDGSQQDYDPLTHYEDNDPVRGHISGEAGIGSVPPPVPEPMTFVMLLSGIPFALLSYRRWKKNKAAQVA